LTVACLCSKCLDRNSRLNLFLGKNERMELKFKVPRYIIWKETASCKEDNINGKDESIPVRFECPQPIFPFFEVGNYKEKVKKV
jgi:hypothetical protein